MKLLLHACCAPCACYPTERLTSQGIDFTILFYNPNIHPFKEFKHRLETLREFVTKKNYQLLIDKSYPLEACIKGMLAEKEVRCAYCYRMRLRYAAAYAQAHGFDAFSTTLLVSPYQKHDLIRREAEAAAQDARAEALLRAFESGAADLPAFAAMYGLALPEVQQALARARLLQAGAAQTAV